MTSLSASEARSAAKRLPVMDWFLAIALLAVAGAAIRALMFTPADFMQGAAQRIFYIHVPSAIIGMYVSCSIMAIAGALFLWIKDERLDRIAESAAEVGFLFLSLVLVTGAIWGKVIWGTAWAWEPRLTSALFLWFVVLSYMILRDAIENHEARARLSAVLGVLALLLVPFIHMTVYLFRGLHPDPVVLKPSKPSMPPEMLMTFGVSMLALFILYIALVRMRYRWATVRDSLASTEGM